MTSPVRGWIEVNRSRLPELLQAFVGAFSDHPVYLAVWHAPAIDVARLPPHIVRDQVPYPGSGSILPGSAFVLVVDCDSFTASLARAVCSAIHLELSSNGATRFAAYDNFTSVCYWEGVSQGMLAALKKEGMIWEYQLHDTPRA